MESGREFHRYGEAAFAVCCRSYDRRRTNILLIGIQSWQPDTVERSDAIPCRQTCIGTSSSRTAYSVMGSYYLLRAMTRADAIYIYIYIYIHIYIYTYIYISYKHQNSYDIVSVLFQKNVKTPPDAPDSEMNSLQPSKLNIRRRQPAQQQPASSQ